MIKWLTAPGNRLELVAAIAGALALLAVLLALLGMIPKRWRLHVIIGVVLLFGIPLTLQWIAPAGNFFATIGHWLAIPRHGWELVAYIGGAVLVGAVFLGLLCVVPKPWRKPVVIGVTFVSGLYYALEFLIPHKNIFTTWKSNVADVSLVVGSFTVLLGISNLLQMHFRSVSRKSKGWGSSLALLVSFFSIMILGFLKDGLKGQGAAVSGNFYSILFEGFLTSLNSTMFSLVAFYIVSAAYRAFRIRSTEAGLMMAAATIIMLALVPIGAAITSWLPTEGFFSAFRLERLGYWLLTSPNMAAQRAVSFGIGVGALAMSLRIWLSLERGSFYDRQL